MSAPAVPQPPEAIEAATVKAAKRVLELRRGPFDYLKVQPGGSGVSVLIQNHTGCACRILTRDEVEVLIRELGFMLAGGEPQEPPSEPEP